MRGTGESSAIAGNPSSHPLKRALDVGLGAVLSLIAAPIVLLLAVGCALTFRCWPFFCQSRVGWQGRPFRIVKLRTLPPSAPSQADKFVIEQIELPRFASFLRSTHLDELPQLFLVPLGRMSLVGPRPEMAFLHGEGDPDFAAARVTVRPGCTGLWQVSGAARGLIWQAMEYDRYYLANSCLRLDLWILYRTLFTASRATAISIDDVPRWTRRRAVVAVAETSQTVAESTSVAPLVIDLRAVETREPIGGTAAVTPFPTGSRAQAARRISR